MLINGVTCQTPLSRYLDYVTLGLLDEMKQLALGLVGRGLRAADRNRAA